MDGLRILSLDGGGVRGLSSLIILGSIMRSVVYDNPEKGSLDDVRPCEYFDYITGVGMGGVIALLLGRLRLTIPECLAEYRNLSSTILRDGCPVPPLFDNKKLVDVAYEIVRKHSPNDQILCESDFDSAVKTFAYAVQTSGQPYCFRTYKVHKNEFSLEDMDPNGILLRDTFPAIVAAKGLFEDETLKDPGHSISFSDQPYPLGFSNPIIHALKEINQLSNNAPVSVIVSIGSGKVAKKDVADLLLLGRLHQTGAYKILDWWLSIPRVLRLADGAGLILWLGKLVADRQVQDTLDKLDENEKLVKAELNKMKILEKYNRFEIGPVEGVGPSDFRSVKKVVDRTRGYLQINAENIERCAREIKRKGCPVPGKDENSSMLLAEAAENGHEKEVRQLLDNGAKLDSKDNDGRTPLSRAAEKGHKAVVRLLLDKGADKTSKDNDGRSPFSWATWKWHTAARLMLNKGADKTSKNNGGRRPFSWAEWKWHTAVRLLLDTGKVGADLRDKDGRTPLSWAAGNGHEAVVKLLLGTGKVEVDSKDNRGRTPLSWAAQNGHEAVVKLLRSAAETSS